MSDTPKTDANCGWPVGHHGRIESSDMKLSPDGPFVHSSVARELECENAALRAAIAESEEFGRKNGETLAAKVSELLRENAALLELTSTLGAPNHINIPVEKWHELRADKERLDWLSSQKDQPWLYWERPLRLTREAIDAFRKEAQP